MEDALSGCWVELQGCAPVRTLCTVRACTQGPWGGSILHCASTEWSMLLTLQRDSSGGDVQVAKVQLLKGLCNIDIALCITQTFLRCRPCNLLLSQEALQGF